MIEKEVRYLIDEQTKESILKSATDISKEARVVDITIGKDGFNSLANYGYIIRLREKNQSKKIEMKKRTDTNEWIEYSTKVDDFSNALKMFDVMGYKPYLLLDKTRINAKHGNLILAFDKVSLLGDYLEIEYQESNINEVYEFLKTFNIEDKPQELYGDIFKSKIENDKEFKNKYEHKLNEYMK